MSDQNIMDEFERMLENMNLTEEKKVHLIAFGLNIDLFTLGAIANAANRKEKGDVNDEQQDCGEKQVNLLRGDFLKKADRLISSYPVQIRFTRRLHSVPEQPWAEFAKEIQLHRKVALNFQPMIW